ncbi:MAG: NAD-binding protein, partial [Sphaerochaetaceae bacterium]|nr:NAD-binding protein [Sphaerochaetaceae bacterium]
DMRQRINGEFIIAALNRNGSAMVPSGDTVVMAGDVLCLSAKEEGVEAILSSVGRRRQKPKSIIIVGASQVADFLVRLFPVSQHKNIAVIDKDSSVCQKFATKYPSIMVLNADVTSDEVFEEEGLGNYDLLVALTGNDELNIITASYAKHFGIKNSMALITKNPNYVQMTSHLEIDSVISTQDVTVDSLMRYLHGTNVSSVHSLFDGKIEAFEFVVKKGCPVVGKALKEINMKGKGIIAGVTKNKNNDEIKDEESIIPSGNYIIEEGDSLVVVTERESNNFIRTLFGSVKED